MLTKLKNTNTGLASRRHRCKGVALIATLVFLFILTIIVVLFLEEVEDRIVYRAQTGGNDELRNIAYDYLTHTIGVLHEFSLHESTLISDLQGWGDPLAIVPFPYEVEGLKAKVRVVDDTAKLPLSNIDADGFVTLLESLGVDAFSASGLRDKYLDWIDEDEETRLQGAEAREYKYSRGRYPLSPANKELDTVDDFRFIAGFADWLDPFSKDYNPELYAAFTSMLTVDHDYPVNLNIASDDILEFFRIHGRLDPDGLLRFKAGGDILLNTEDDELIDLAEIDEWPLLKSALGEMSRNELMDSQMRRCKIYIDLVRYDTYRFHLQATLDLGGGSENPTIAVEDKENSEETNLSRENRDEQEEPEGRTNAGRASQSNETMFEVLVIKENI